ncbi:hypothetical protein ACTQWG_07215 [Blautia sp. HCP3S3_H10_1]|uniref:hypothetical protein n=1 Tax=unclassified Blautia TaxID=2648079 RepID=UPI003F8F6551
MVAISIPIFNSQLEKSREAVDAANIRAAYAEVASAVLTKDSAKVKSKAIDVKQKKAEWQTTIDFTGELATTEKDIMGTGSNNTVPKKVWVIYTPSTTGGAAGTFAVVSSDPTGYTQVD